MNHKPTGERPPLSRRAGVPPPPGRQRGPGWLGRLLIMVAVFGLLACAGFLALTRLLAVRIPVLPTGRVAPNLDPLEALVLESYLGLRAGDLERSMVPEAEPLLFEVAPGSTAAVIADELVQRGLVDDATLFRNYVRYAGLDSQLEAGKFRLSASMTIPEIAQALTDALSPDVTVQVIEGWRLEQIGEALDATEGLAFGGAEFVALVGPGAARPAGFGLLEGLPPGASLEGFLFPDTYRLAPDATAADLRDRMLENFDERVPAQMRADAAARRFTLYEVVALASIVEREAIIPAERALIAGVYLNRLTAGMTLDADPTVQYAQGFDALTGQWWPPLSVADYTAVTSPYNTYLNTGLPPGPIANPSLASIEAVIHPASSDYLYFRACDDSGRHVFSLTFAEHERACD